MQKPVFDRLRLGTSMIDCTIEETELRSLELSRVCSGEAPAEGSVYLELCWVDEMRRRLQEMTGGGGDGEETTRRRFEELRIESGNVAETTT